MKIKYAFLLLPSLNRVYFETLKKIAVSELGILRNVLNNAIENIKIEVLGSVPYVTFISSELSTQDIDYISNHSSFYSIYKINENGEFNPLDFKKRDLFDDDLLTIQKYPGKTNEYFTKLLMNVTLVSSDFNFNSKLRILDPVCGRGTTLLQALNYGFDSVGIEKSKSLVSSFENFIKFYMKMKKLKHSFNTVKKQNKLILETAATKEKWNKNKKVSLIIINDDTRNALKIFPENNFHFIIGDLPYGVKHGSLIDKSKSRSPEKLVSDSILGWKKMLKNGGCLGLSWNVNTMDKEKLSDMISDSGLKVIDNKDLFLHRVDQSVRRDIIIAKKYR